jgi:hypothetical protein
MRALKISGKSCKLSTKHGVYVENESLEDIVKKQFGDFDGTVDIEINITEIDTSLKIQSNAEPEIKEDAKE